jgi:hypothetical protein
MTNPNYIQSYINTGHGQEAARNFVIYAPINISIITGYYILTSPSTINLSDVSTSAIITIINSPQPNSISVDPNNSNYFYILQSGAYTFQITYTDTIPNPNITYSDYIGFSVVLPIYLPQSNDVYNIIKRSEPQNVYTQVAEFTTEIGNNTYSNEYCDSFPTANIFNALYSDLNVIYQNILPSGGSSYWELTLNNTVGLLSNTPLINIPNPYYNVVLSMLYSLLVNNTGNKFDVSFFLSKYVFYRSNESITCYVYIQETTVIPVQVWELNSSILGINTRLGSGVNSIYQVNVYFLVQTGDITQDLRNELTKLVPRILPFGYSYSIFFDYTLVELGLTTFIGQTWKYDPRLRAFAIEFDPFNVNQANGYINPTAPQALISIALIPASGTLNLGAQTYAVIGTYYSGVTADITSTSIVISSNSSVLDITGLGTMTALLPGPVNLTASYGPFSVLGLYVVLEIILWELNISELNSNTILG